MKCCNMTKFGIYDLENWAEESLSYIASAETREKLAEKILKRLGWDDAKKVRIKSEVVHTYGTIVVFKTFLECSSLKLLNEAFESVSAKEILT